MFLSNSRSGKRVISFFKRINPKKFKRSPNYVVALVWGFVMTFTDEFSFRFYVALQFLKSCFEATFLFNLEEKKNTRCTLSTKNTQPLLNYLHKQRRGREYHSK